MNPVTIEGTGIISVSEYRITINGKSLIELLHKNLNCPKYKDIPAKIHISIEPIETNLTINGEPWEFLLELNKAEEK
jgi:hypothetical protein